MKKILFIVIDGLGDKPIKELSNKTPLEAARTPNLDFLTKNGICGLIKPVFTGAIPTSEEGHLSLFGYDPRACQIRRGFFTATGAGLKVKRGDVALRGNFGTVDEKLNIIDRRARRISETKPLIESLKDIVIEGVRFLIKSAGEHRLGIVLRGKGLSSKISDGDPHYSSLRKKVKKIVPLDKSYEARRTARVLNKFLKKAHQVLKNHPFNKKREKLGLYPANYILVRGASTFQKLPSFKKKYGLRACCVAGKLLYKQIGKFLGMKVIKVKGADGSPNTNLRGKFLTAKKALKKYDFCFLHIKATDSLAEDGNFQGKKEFIEKIDKNLRPILNLRDTLIIVTSDHSTCCDLRRHCKEPFPVLIFGAGNDRVKKFSEKNCKKGKLGKVKSIELLNKVFEMLK